MRFKRCYRGLPSILGVVVGATVVCCSGIATAQLSPQLQPAPPTAPMSPLGGGLLPPPPPENPESQKTVQALEQAERQDSGRGLSFIWLSVDPVFSLTNLALLKDSGFSDPKLLSASALGFGAGGTLGVRFLYLSLAAQFRYVAATAYDDWTLGLLASLHVPFGRLEPRVSLGGGYLRAFNFEHESEIYALGAKQNNLVASGFDLMLQGGVDYYITPVFSVGLTLEGQLLFLGRDRVVDEPSTSFGRDASAVGMKVDTTLNLGLHF